MRLWRLLLRDWHQCKGIIRMDKFHQQYNYGIPVCQVLPYLQRLSLGRLQLVTESPLIPEISFLTGLNVVWSVKPEIVSCSFTSCPHLLCTEVFICKQQETKALQPHSDRHGIFPWRMYFTSIPCNGTNHEELQKTAFKLLNLQIVYHLHRISLSTVPVLFGLY